jgi:membrane protein implicated in regulation of membrane protease activity
MQRVYVTNVGWGTRIMAILGVALGLALAAALVVLSIGIAIVLLPVVAVIAAIGWWRLRRMTADLRRQATAEGRAPQDGYRVIETEYEIVGPDDPPRR